MLINANNCFYIFVLVFGHFQTVIWALVSVSNSQQVSASFNFGQFVSFVYLIWIYSNVFDKYKISNYGVLDPALFWFLILNKRMKNAEMHVHNMLSWRNRIIFDFLRPCIPWSMSRRMVSKVSQIFHSELCCFTHIGFNRFQVSIFFVFFCVEPTIAHIVAEKMLEK